MIISTWFLRLTLVLFSCIYLVLASHIATLFMLYLVCLFGMVHRDGTQKYVGRMMEFIENLRSLRGAVNMMTLLAYDVFSM